MKATKRITVSLVEDDEQTRDTITAILRKKPSLEFLDAYPSAEAALAGLAAQRPDVLLVDIRLPRMSGIECVAHLKSGSENNPALQSDLQVLMLTTYEERELIFDSLRAGASGYILKNALRNELVQAIEQVHAGGAPMSMSIARKLVGFFQNGGKPPPGGASADMENLTHREQEILTLISRGYQYKEIAEK